MAGYWLKLYTEILEDPKYYRLTDSAKLGMIELMLVAKKVGLEGEIPSIEDVAFYTRRSVDWWTPVFEELSKIEYLVVNGTETIIRKFAERQAAVDGTERIKKFRELKHKNEFVKRDGNEPVTNRYGDSETETETEKRRVETDLTPPPAFSPGFVDSRPVIDVNYSRVWNEITGRPGIPASDQTKVIDAIDQMRPKFKDENALITYLKPYWEYWQTKRTKDNRPYSKANCAWLYDLALMGEPLPADKKKMGNPDPDCGKCGGNGWYLDKRNGMDKMTVCDCVKVLEEVSV